MHAPSAPNQAHPASAEEYFVQYLKENADAASTIHKMRGNIAAFRTLFVEMLLRRCMDGRNQSTKGLGIPPTVAMTASSHGNIANVGPTNTEFWKPLDDVAGRAASRRGNAPALFISEAHKSTRAHGCAAHHHPEDTPLMTNARALACVIDQVEGIRRAYTAKEIYPVAAMVDTDTMARRFCFKGGVELCTESMISRLQLTKPADVFQQGFLKQPIDNPRIRDEVDGRTPGEMLEGQDPSLYQNLRTAIAMQEYLLGEASAVDSAGGRRNHVFNPLLIDAIQGTLNGVKDLPPQLRRIFTHIAVWNCAYALYQHDRLEGMNDAEHHAHLEHGEGHVCYGNRDGFATLRRNTGLVVTPGTGDDGTPLAVGLKVWKSVERNKDMPPMAHINIEQDDPPSSWDAFNTLLSELRTRTRTVSHVFGPEARMLTTYSYGGSENGHPAKQFYPVQPAGGNNQTAFTHDLSQGLTPETFSASKLRHREEDFVREMLNGNGH